MLECPYCHSRRIWADFVDVGVGGGGMQVTPYMCEDCGAAQMDGSLKKEDMTEDEKRTGWHRSPYYKHRCRNE